MSTISMTGFGDAQLAEKDLTLSIEIRSVNHRFVDINFKLPAVYSRYESELSKIIQGKIRRGRLEIFVSRKRAASATGVVNFDSSLFQAYLAEIRKAFEIAGLDQAGLAPAVVQVLSKREVLDTTTTEEVVADEYPLISKLLTDALDKLIAMRGVEGAQLELELHRLLAVSEAAISEIKSKSEKTAEELRLRLLKRIEKMLPDLSLDQNRLSQEVAYLVERADITEELARLDSHLILFRQTLTSGEGGRKLDFIIQEMGREVNTIGSKSQDSTISPLVVELKATFEKLREQVQNVE